MTVLITDPNAFNRLCAVEGEHFREYGNGHPAHEGAYGFRGFLAEWNDVTDYCAEAGSQPADVLLNGLAPEGGDGAIYGQGGTHRYFVLATGEIVFSRGHSTDAARARAREQGFRVQG